jgi:hypothetical protein
MLLFVWIMIRIWVYYFSLSWCRVCVESTLSLHENVEVGSGWGVKRRSGELVMHFPLPPRCKSCGAKLWMQSCGCNERSTPPSHRECVKRNLWRAVSYSSSANWYWLRMAKVCPWGGQFFMAVTKPFALDERVKGHRKRQRDDERSKGRRKSEGTTKE